MDKKITSSEKLLLRVLRGEKVERVPVWLMRQAGQYLEEYRAVRSKVTNFLDLCYSTKLALEVTLQPIQRFGFDAAIVFADILLVPDALGQKVTFEQGEGPKLFPRLSPETLSILSMDRFHERLCPVYETLKQLKNTLPSETTLIGFAGAPWTVATYMIEGQGSKNHENAKKWLLTDPYGFEKLMDILTSATIEFLCKQIDAGAEVIQIFDSWAGSLNASGFHQWVIKPFERITHALHTYAPHVPLIGFPKGAGTNIKKFVFESGTDAISLDPSLPAEWIRDHLQARQIVQGNLDPYVLAAGGKVLERETKHLLETLGPSRYIFNLGHGIIPSTNPAHIDFLLQMIRG